MCELDHLLTVSIFYKYLVTFQTTYFTGLGEIKQRLKTNMSASIQPFRFHQDNIKEKCSAYRNRLFFVIEILTLLCVKVFSLVTSLNFCSCTLQVLLIQVLQHQDRIFSFTEDCHQVCVRMRGKLPTENRDSCTC